MTEGVHIVVVDDEAAVRETFEEYLQLQGFKVTALPGAPELREMIDSGASFDIAILDVSMPGEDGLSLARYLREHSSIGILMVTASAKTVDRIIGLEIGADDYIAKPVDLRELLARIKAVLRRLGGQAQAPGAAAADANRLVPFGAFKLDLDAHKLFDQAGEEVSLTAMEFDLLKAFAERPNRVLSRHQLLELAHNRDWEPFDRSIDIRIARLRRKVEPDPEKPQIIRTVRGAGYMFSPDRG